MLKKIVVLAVAVTCVLSLVSFAGAELRVGMVF